MRSKLIYILLLLTLPVLFISCESEQAKPEQVIIEPTVENVKDGASVIIGTTLDMTADAIDGYENRVSAELNGALNKTTDGTVDFVNGWWVWENTIEFGEFRGVYERKCQFLRVEDGPVVMSPSQADYMKAEVTAVGKFGYPDWDPNYGTSFDNSIELEMSGMNSNVRVIRGEAHIEKVSDLVYNGEDAHLYYAVDVELEELQWTKTLIGESITLKGQMTITMDDWLAEINCESSPAYPYADVVVYHNGEKVNEFAYDLRNFRVNNLVNGQPKF